MHWESYSHTKLKKIVFDALEQNLDYRHKPVLGLPASYLDTEVFYQDAPFLKDAPFLSAMIANPNHIGCHTLNESERAFEGTQKIESELIQLCAKEIFEGEDDHYDGYVASGGTEANIQAIWILKRYYEQEYGAKPEEIALAFTEDAHYSMPKAGSLLSLDRIVLPVDTHSRKISFEAKGVIKEAKNEGKKYFILVLNMGTTMFGSIDDVDEVCGWMDELEINFKVHIDAAFGGFIYPFAQSNSKMTFKNPKIISFTLDGHKMLQSPYGTGIYITREGFMDYALTEEANYVKGKDYTLIGSRSGANAIAVWMIMRTYGSEGWKMKIKKLLEKTDRLCEQLDAKGIGYYRNSSMNIVTIKSEYIDSKTAQDYLLVPDTHDGQPNWYKIVVMDHVTQGLLDRFLLEVHPQPV
ncbi:L-histidine carboxy-lyase (histamine-forming) [Ekhidna lutea]|uniref:L-histidine carboxy-lyase (Histamine-forming) n=1 Tax=Ekhidna lutea TaxID=447679 RepID=A0A239H753_EKHLU|nr:pyridoxal-dependent decarboxylase [Ekhidna lutea]SNS76975.1 L-histidine carboxy-lyase (histamine-forming) [Ekhidna lutea]